jgi:hypothetical protein
MKIAAIMLFLLGAGCVRLALTAEFGLGLPYGGEKLLALGAFFILQVGCQLLVG